MPVQHPWTDDTEKNAPKVTSLGDGGRPAVRPHHVCNAIFAAKQWPPEFPSVQHARLSCFLVHAEYVVELERNAEVLATLPPGRVVRQIGRASCKERV